MPEQPIFPSLEFDPGRKVLTVDEVALKIAVSRNHVIALIESGKLKAFTVGIGKHRYFRIPVESYRALLRNGTAEI